MKSDAKPWFGFAGRTVARAPQEPVEPMRELNLEELDDQLYAGVGLAQDTWGAAQVSRDASHHAWSVLHLLPATVAR